VVLLLRDFLQFIIRRCMQKLQISLRNRAFTSFLPTFFPQQCTAEHVQLKTTLFKIVSGNVVVQLPLKVIDII
jgi:hypothetical protein